MPDSVDAPQIKVPEPDPRFREFPIPDTVDAVIARIVEFVGFGIDDAGGIAYRPEVNGAEADFKDYWGRFVERQLKRYPDNPWPDQWKNVVLIAKRHAQHAVELAKAAHRKPISHEDFVEGGKLAATECASLFGRARFLGCWCNDC
jgi:hypothetical protein